MWAQVNAAMLDKFVLNKADDFFSLSIIMYFADAPFKDDGL